MLSEIRVSDFLSVLLDRIKIKLYCDTYVFVCDNMPCSNEIKKGWLTNANEPQCGLQISRIF